MNRLMRRAFHIFALLCVAFVPARAQVLRPIGPTGGSVQCFGQDPANPRRVFLGTADGHVFGSQDGGAHWHLLGRAGQRSDSVITAILVDPRDPQALYASAWTRDPAAGGGVFRSGDGGRTWTAAGLAGQAVRALAMAPSSPDTLVAGTLDGVYRTRDAGRTWSRISPPGDAELRNLDSLAVDPKDPDVIYAGTFHLLWKTTDGGLNWNSMHAGMIDDSDVMSILVDRAQPGRVYASACSGIYRSDDGGSLWQKVQGIPYESRRTAQILQDPQHPEIVYAATTEGLWKSIDSGSTWSRMTPPDWSVTGVVLQPADAGPVLIGVEQRGVLSSSDGGAHFAESNEGFFHRQVLALAADPLHVGHVLAQLANAPAPFLETFDGGQTWSPLGTGLENRNVKHIYGTPNGWWAALEQGGFSRYDALRTKAVWVPAARILNVPPRGGIRSGTPTAKPRPASRRFDLIVNDLAFSGTTWYAATNRGLQISRDNGMTWSAVSAGAASLAGTLPIQSVCLTAHGQRVWIATIHDIAESSDAGVSWTWHLLPQTAGSLLKLRVAESEPGAGEMILADTRTGLYISRDSAGTWQTTGFGLPETPLSDLVVAGTAFFASMETGGLYFSRDEGRSWTPLDTGAIQGLFPALAASADGSEVYVASATEGVFLLDWNLGGSASARTKP
jgi:photosystem II stability/assembly factor-like uncharacterized protein